MASELDLQGSFTQALVELGLSAGAAKLLWMPFPMLLTIATATLLALVTTWLERKISAAAQQRIGPEFMGPAGILVPIADVFKLLVKENIVSAKADYWLFPLRPC